MSKKKTVSFQEYVLEVADQKSREMFGGSLSNYLGWLICNDNREKIEKILEEIELKKPNRISEQRPAKYESICPYCGKKIKAGEAIYDVILANGLERFVHKNCSRD